MGLKLNDRAQANKTVDDAWQWLEVFRQQRDRHDVYSCFLQRDRRVQVAPLPGKYETPQKIGSTRRRIWFTTLINSRKQ